MKKNYNFLTFVILSLLFSSCHFVSSFTNEPEIDTTLTFDRNTLSLDIGAMDVITLTTASSQNSASIEWSYDSSIISCKTDNYGAVITALSAGSTLLTATYGASEVSCKVNVNPDIYSAVIANPYVYCSHDYITVTPGSTQKIVASLYGGNTNDIDGFRFSIDDSSKAALTYEGNYCWITGADVGMCKLTINHSKTSYPYTVLVNCTYDNAQTSYITTNNNIVTFDTSKGNETKKVTVNLVNPPTTSYESLFTYTLCDENGKELSLNDAPVRIVNQLGNVFEITSTKKTGQCYLNVSHPKASYNYSLSILLRVVSDNNVSYVDFDLPNSLMLISGLDDAQELSPNLVNYLEEIDNSKFTWTFADNATDLISYDIVNGNGVDTGNFIRIKGKKSGNTKVTVSYPDCTSKSFAIVVRNIESQAAAATTYITTSQNYIKLTTKDSPLNIDIRIFNLPEEERGALIWHFDSHALDGSSDNVVKCSTSYGKAKYSSSRAALKGSQSVNANCTIEPLKAGTATITISHPLAMYPTTINVVVTEPITEIPISYLALNENPIIKLKYGTGTNIKLDYKGNNENEITWEHQNDSANTCTITNNGATAKNVYIAAQSYETQYNDDGELIPEIHPVTINTILVSCPECNSIPITVYCYDDETEITNLNLPSFWTNTSFYDIKVDDTCQFEVFYENLSEYDIVWNVNTDGLECSNGSSKKYLNVKGLKSGFYTISATAGGITLFFNVKVYQDKIINEKEPCYLTTNSNVVYFSSNEQSSVISVTLNNANESAFSEIKWELSNNIAYEINHSNIAYGNNITVSSIASPSSGTITISHPLASNTLTIYLKTGEEFTFQNTDIGYISTTEDTITLNTDDNPYKLYAVINHTESDNQITSGFRFSIADTSVATVNYYQTFNYCEITPKKNGITTLTVECITDTSVIPKEVIIIVNRPSTDSAYPYIKTSQNVVTVLQGEFSSIECSLENVSSGSGEWSWKSENPLIADVIGKGGSVGMISANRTGSTKIVVSNSNCQYSLEIIVLVIDNRLAQNNPYISSSDTIIHLHKGETYTITSKIVGGVDNAKAFFKSNISSAAIAAITQTQDSTFVKAINPGVATITISNTSYSNVYNKNVLVIVDEDTEDGIYIKPSTTIVKLSPKDTKLQTITATLENGEELDNQNFIWWVDDYSMLQLSSVTNNCSITPLGLSGTTKIHISHPKAANNAEILVLISEYENFAFSQTSFQAYTNQIHFVPMQLPAVAQDCTVEFSSEDTNICVAQGSKDVAWICGVNTGYTTINARLLDSNKNEIASSKMFVNVNVVEPNKPYITTSDVIYNMNAGDTAEFNATLNGENLKDKTYRLVWQIDNGSTPYIHFRNYDKNNNNNYFVGNSCVIETASENKKQAQSRQHVLYVYYYEDGVDYTKDDATHSKAISSANILLLVNETGEITIDLSSYYEETFISDGSFDIKASLNNGDSKLLKQITWSAIKQSGANIVSVTGSGNSCKINPLSSGSTIVIARLPTGATAQCSVIVRPNAELIVETREVNVIPGYTVSIPFKKNPGNATLHVLNQYSTNGTSMAAFESTPEYYSYSIDEVNSVINITGKQELNSGKAGTLTLLLSSDASSKKTIDVICQYKPELYIFEDNPNFPNSSKVLNPLETITQVNASQKFTDKTFIIKYFPADMDIEVKIASGENVCKISKKSERFYIDDDEKAYTRITVSPIKEGKATISVKPTLTNAPTATLSKLNKSIDYKIDYSDKYIKENTTIVPIISSGAFSSIEGTTKLDKINLSDGESVSFSVKINDPMIDLQAIHAVYIPNSNLASDVNIQLCKTKAPTIVPTSKDDFKNFYGNEVDASNLNKIFSDSRKLDKAYTLNNNPLYKADYPSSSNGILASEYNSTLKGLIYLNEDTFGNENYLFTLGHGFDYYKRIPRVYFEDKDRIKDNILSQFVVNGYVMVDDFLIDKDLIFRNDNNKLYNTVKHNNTKYFSNFDFIKNDWSVKYKTHSFAGKWINSNRHNFFMGTEIYYSNNLIRSLKIWQKEGKNIEQGKLSNEEYVNYLNDNNEFRNEESRNKLLLNLYDYNFYYIPVTPYTISYEEVKDNYLNPLLINTKKVSSANLTLDNYTNTTLYKNMLGTGIHNWRDNGELWDGQGHEAYWKQTYDLELNETNPYLFHKYLTPTVTKNDTVVKEWNNIGDVYFVVFHNNTKVNVTNVPVSLKIRNCEAYQSKLWLEEKIDSDTVHYISKVPNSTDNTEELIKFYKSLTHIDQYSISIPKGATNIKVPSGTQDIGNNCYIINKDFYSHKLVSSNANNVYLKTKWHGGSRSGNAPNKTISYICCKFIYEYLNTKCSISYDINDVHIVMEETLISPYDNYNFYVYPISNSYSFPSNLKDDTVITFYKSICIESINTTDASMGNYVIEEFRAPISDFFVLTTKPEGIIDDNLPFSTLY